MDTQYLLRFSVMITCTDEDGARAADYVQHVADIVQLMLGGVGTAELENLLHRDDVGNYHPAQDGCSCADLPMGTFD